MRATVKRLGVIAFMLSVSCAQAAPALMDPSKEVDSAKKKVFEDPLSGVVINRTVTVLGNDFYQYFATAWREKDIDNKYSISIYERPSARWGSEIWINFGQNRVFHTFLSPARQAARAVSEQAAEIAYKNIMDSEVQRVLFQSQDLGKEEL